MLIFPFSIDERSCSYPIPWHLRIRTELRASLIQPPQSFKRGDKPKWLPQRSVEATPNFLSHLLVWVRGLLFISGVLTARTIPCHPVGPQRCLFNDEFLKVPELVGVLSQAPSPAVSCPDFRVRKL